MQSLTPLSPSLPPLPRRSSFRVDLLDVYYKRKGNIPWNFQENSYLCAIRLTQEKKVLRKAGLDCAGWDEPAVATAPFQLTILSFRSRSPVTPMSTLNLRV